MEQPSIIDPTCAKLHEEACANGSDTYIDPQTGYTVMTALFLRRRGWCCGQRCRHCPYDPPHQGRRVTKLLMALLIFFASAVAQSQLAIDTVLSFRAGTGQNVGQGPVFFPQNIFRGPDPSARQTVQSMDPRYICSLGLGGAIDVGYVAAVIVDGPGPDFVVHENAFTYVNNKVFAEPGVVSVSRDGVTWHTFACDSAATLQGCAGVTPLRGDEYDLADLGVDSVRWVRIEDRSGAILRDRNHPFYDPTITGFDMDVVIAMHSVPVVFKDNVQYRITSGELHVDMTDNGSVAIYNMLGRAVYERALAKGFQTVLLDTIPSGCYIVRVRTGSRVQTIKVIR